MQEKLSIKFDTNVKIIDPDTNEVFLDKSNAIHSQNMSRIIARSLANEPNGIFHRLALGNGGSFVDAGNNIVINPPNDGNNGDGWESRLYNETYSEIVDNLSENVGVDPGSFGPNSSRPGGGSNPSQDNRVTSQEVGIKSNIELRMFIDKEEPTGQLASQSPGEEIVPGEQDFFFDELGIYSPGKAAASSSAFSSVDVGNKLSTDVISTLDQGTYNINLEVDGITVSSQINVPTDSVTFGDLCEGINTGNWVSGDSLDDIIHVFITDRSDGVYPTILGEQSYGFLTFKTETTGDDSSINLICDDNDPDDIFNVITGSVCQRVNVNQLDGSSAGVMNDPVTSENERERLLTHITFAPISKSALSSILIVYTLTVSVVQTGDTLIETTTTNV